MLVIIGAGPAGLYTALMLLKNGISLKEILICDPRAGEYTRPGHLDESVYLRAEKGINESFWEGDFGHIKDLERHLYHLVRAKGIRIEKKRFTGIYPDANNPGILLEDGEGLMEYFAADYVFDCTGSARKVSEAVNFFYPDSPFQINRIIDVPVKNHFLAYVKMPEKIVHSISLMSIRNIYKQNSIVLARSLLKLRELGWDEFVFPRCYGVPFEKEKVCLYLEAPENLTRENHERWVQTVLQAYDPNASYRHLNPSKKYKSKPRFTPFSTDAMFLKAVCWKGKDLPMVIPLGDAQIDPDYFLAHGIWNGMKRINLFFECISIENGKIVAFDQITWKQMMQEKLEKHKKEIIKQAAKRKKDFEGILPEILDKMLAAKHQQISTEDKEVVRQLTEAVTEKIFANIRHADIQKKLRLVLQNPRRLWHAADLIRPFALSAALAAYLKNYGDDFFQSGNMISAIENYRLVLAIYALPEFCQNYVLERLVAASDLLTACLCEKIPDQALATAREALQLYLAASPWIQQQAPSENIFSNYMQVLALLESEKPGDFREEIESLLALCAKVLSPQNARLIQNILFEKLQIAAPLTSPGKQSIFSSTADQGNANSRQKAADIERFEGTSVYTPDHSKSNILNLA